MGTAYNQTAYADVRWEKIKTRNEEPTYLRRTTAMKYSRCWQKRSGVLMFANIC
jgi:hypothetical protein